MRKWVDPKDPEMAYEWTKEELIEAYREPGLDAYAVASVEHDGVLFIYYMDSSDDRVCLDTFIPKPPERFYWNLNGGKCTVYERSGGISAAIAYCYDENHATFIVNSLRKAHEQG